MTLVMRGRLSSSNMAGAMSPHAGEPETGKEAHREERRTKCSRGLVREIAAVGRFLVSTAVHEVGKALLNRVAVAQR